MKTCFKCGAEKPLSEFYKHPGMADGHLNKCKECNKRDVRKNRQDKREYYLDYDRNRPNHTERVRRGSDVAKKKYKEDESYRESIIVTKRKWAENNEHKKKAHQEVSNALRDGRLTKLNSCEHCDKTGCAIQGHHWSYEPEHRLDVIWLCSVCHGKEHKRLNELERQSNKTKPS